MDYSQLLSDCWAYGSSYWPLCGLSTWTAAFLPGFGAGEIISIGTRRFRALQKLGEGGYAVVLLVTEIATADRPQPDPELRALKKVLVQSGEHFDAVQQEMMIHSTVQHHPHVLPLLDYSCSEGHVGPGPGGAGSEAGALAAGGLGGSAFADPGVGFSRVAYFLFPVFRDGTLASELGRLAGRGEMLPTAEVLSIFVQLAKAAAHIHSHGFAHRDIKPLNALIAVNPDHPSSRQQQQQRQQQRSVAAVVGWLRPSEREVRSEEDVEARAALTGTDTAAAAGPRYRCVLMDLGSARTYEVEVATRAQAMELQEDAEAHCSAPYRAPELFDVPSPGLLDYAACDVWALGACLFETMYGEPPFARAMNAGGGSLALAVLNCAIGWPRPPSPAYPPQLHQLVMAAMAPEPGDRPTAAQLVQMAEALAQQHLPDPTPQRGDGHSGGR